MPGTKQGSGSLDYVHSPPNPPWLTIGEGNFATLSLMFYNASTAPPWALPSSGTWTVPALFGSIKYDVDIDDGAIIGGSADFVTNGAWTVPSAGLMLPPGEIPNPDGSIPPSAMPICDLQAMDMLPPEQLASLAQKIAAMMQAKNLKPPSWVPHPEDVKKEAAA